MERSEAMSGHCRKNRSRKAHIYHEHKLHAKARCDLASDEPSKDDAVTSMMLEAESRIVLLLRRKAVVDAMQITGKLENTLACGIICLASAESRVQLRTSVTLKELLALLGLASLSNLGPTLVLST